MKWSDSDDIVIEKRLLFLICEHSQRQEITQKFRMVISRHCFVNYVSKVRLDGMLLQALQWVRCQAFFSFWPYYSQL